MIDSFNGRLRDECLNAHEFVSLDDVRATLSEWREVTITAGHTAHWVIGRPASSRSDVSNRAAKRQDSKNGCYESRAQLKGSATPVSRALRE
jgi:hypothetical protein